MSQVIYTQCDYPECKSKTELRLTQPRGWIKRLVSVRGAWSGALIDTWVDYCPKHRGSETP